MGSGDAAVVNKPAQTVLRDSRCDSTRPLLMSSQENSSADMDSLEDATAAALRSLDSNRPASISSLPLGNGAADSAEPLTSPVVKPLLMFEDDFVPPSTSDAFKTAPSDSVNTEKAANQNSTTVAQPNQGAPNKGCRLLLLVKPGRPLFTQLDDETQGVRL